MKYLLMLMLVISFRLCAGDLYPFHSLQKQRQFQYLIHHLRCVVCQDESLSASNASIAVDLRADVYRMVQDNQSNDAIEKYLVQRYGNFVLLKPPFIAETYLLWLAPLLLLCAGVFIVLKTIRQ